jgi:hypothetical protein
MRSLLVKVLIFAALNATLWFAYEWKMPEPSSSIGYKRQIAETHLEADTLILGSSHATLGVVPRCLGAGAVNLANTSQDLYYDCAIAGLYLPRMPQLRRIVLEVSFFTWEYAISRSIEGWREELYYHALGIPPQYCSWKLGHYSRIAAYGTDRAIFGRREPNLFDREGWLGMDKTLDPKTGKTAADRHLSSMALEEIPTNVTRAAALVRKCTSRGVEAVLLTLPAHECYRVELNQGALKRMRDTTELFCSENRVRHFDYFSDGRFTTEDFADGDHLNARGAEKFTKILTRDLGAAAVSLRAGR